MNRLLMLIFACLVACGGGEHKKKADQPKAAVQKQTSVAPVGIPAAVTPVNVPAAVTSTAVGVAESTTPSGATATDDLWPATTARKVTITGHGFILEDGRYYYPLPEGGNIWTVETAFGIRHWVLYHANRAEFEDLCREIEGSGKCSYGRWARLLPAGSQIEIPGKYIELLKKQGRLPLIDKHKKKTKAKTGQVIKKPADTNVSPAARTAAAPASKRGQIAPPKPVLYEDLEKQPVPPADAPTPTSSKKRSSANESSSPVSQCASAVPVLDAHNSQTNATYRVCLASGSISEPLSHVEARWLVDRKPDMLSRVGELPTRYACLVSLNCTRTEVWQPL